MNIQVNISDLDKTTRRKLANIAKRTRAEDGSLVFADVAPSEKEMETLHDFYADAVTLLNTTSQYFVTATTTPTADGQAVGMVTLTFPTNHNEAMNTTLIAAFSTFLVAYAVYAWLAIVNPAATERYQQAMREKLEALIQIIFHKTPPNHDYVLDVPPTISSPGTLRLGFNEQRIIAYSLGSDGLDDLDIVSDSVYVTVHKNADRTFSVINANTTDAVVLATVTIGRGTKIAALDSNGQPILDENGDPTYTFTTVLEKIAVSALTQSAGATIVTNPILIGLRTLSDSIELQTGDTRKITYTGTIESIVHSGGIIAAAELIAEDGQTKILITAGANAGRETFILYGANGWSYTLYCNVMEQQATLPEINHSSLAAIRINETFDIPYTLGSDNFDDIVMTASNSAVTLEKVSASHKYVVTGANVGDATIRVTSARHPEINTYISVRVMAVHGLQEPHIYVTENTINTVAGADPTRILFYPGEKGTFTVTSSDTSKVVVVQGNGYVDIIPLATTVANSVDSPVTIIFTNNATEFQDGSHNNWTQTISVSVAAIPAVVTPPIIYWPDSLVMKEGGIGISVEYVLGSDRVDGFAAGNNGGCSSSDTDVVTIARNEPSSVDALHSFTITPRGLGSATIHIWDPIHGIDRYETVVVSWVEPKLISVKDGDELTLPEVYEPADGFDSSDTSTNPTLGTNGLAIELYAPSSGNVSVSASPAGRLAYRVQNVITYGGRPKKKVVIFALQEGIAYVTFSCQNWSERVIIKIKEQTGQNTNTDTNVQTLPGISFSQNSFSVSSNNTTGKPTLYNAFGVTVHYSSSNTSVATVNETTGELTIVGNGTCYIYATSVATDRYYSQTVFYALNVNIASNTPTLLSAVDNSTDVYGYYKGTIEGVTNPLIWISEGELFLCSDDEMDYLYVYDESNNTVDSVSYPSSSDISTIISTIIDAISDNYGYTVTEAQSNLMGSSQSLTITNYILPDSSSGNATTPLPQMTSSSGDGTYYLKGTVAEVTNPVFAIDTIGNSNLVLLADGGHPYVYDEQTQTVSLDTQHTLSSAPPNNENVTVQNCIEAAIQKTLSGYSISIGGSVYTGGYVSGDAVSAYALYVAPSVNGSTSRTISANGEDTIVINNGLGLVADAESSDSSVVRAVADYGSVTIYARSAGSATVSILCTDDTVLTVTYTVSAAQQSGTIAAYSGQTGNNNGGIYCYLKGFVSLLQAPNGGMTNPVVHIQDGYVKACADSDGYLLSYDEETGVYSRGAYYNGATIRQNNVCDKAIELAAAQGTTLAKSDTSSENMERSDNFPAPTLYMSINN